MVTGFIAMGNASKTRYGRVMKTATLPSIRVEPELRSAVESLLGERETLTEFVETAVRETASRRRAQAEFLARGIQLLEEARRTDDYVAADLVLEKLRQRLGAAKTQIQSRPQ